MKPHLLLIYLVFSGFLSKSAVVVDDQSEWQNIGDKTSLSLSGESINSLGQFIGLNKKVNNPLYSVPQGSVAWLKYEIINKGQEAHSLLIHTGLHIEDITYFWQTHDGWDSTTLGHLHPISERKIQSRHLATSRTLAPKDTTHLIVRYRAINKASPIYLFIEPTTTFFNGQIATYVFLSLFYGILVYLLFHSILHAFLDRTKLQLHYAIYVASVLLYLSFRDGLAFQYIWPELPNINLFHAPVSFLLLLLGTSAYASHFTSHPSSGWIERIEKSLLVLVTLHVTLFLLGISIPFDLSFLYYAVYLIIYYQLISILLKERRPRQLLFVLGYTLMLGGWVIFKLQELQWIKWSYFVEYYIYGALLLEAIFFAVSLAQKSKELIAENSRKQDQLISELKTNEELKSKVNRELESLVASRTSELNESHKQLESLSTEVDKLNWSLKKEVESEKLARIGRQVFTFEEFKEVFPTSLSCLHYLGQLKLDSKTCDKEDCGLESRTSTDKKVDIICPHCKTKESATQHTLFHALKFDIVKALYLAYLEFQQHTSTNEDLSQQIDLRSATVWNFRKKVRDRLEKQRDTSWKELLIKP